jgi:hypothetical protein
MSSVDDVEQEPFKLTIPAIQGRWMCEELGAALTVSGQSVQYASGECYPIDVTPEGKLEIFGYRGVEKKSDASSVIWKHRETGQALTWMYEGDAEEVDPEVDASLIIQGSGGRSSRKRKVDYVALDKELDKELSGQRGDFESIRAQARATPAMSERDMQFAFLRMKDRFHKWIQSTNTERCLTILQKRGYLSTDIDFIKNAVEEEAARRLIDYVKALGAKAMTAQSGLAVYVRVPESIWKQLSTIAPASASTSTEASVDAELQKSVERIRDSVVAYLSTESHSEEETRAVEDALVSLEALPVTLDVLKITKIGVEINKLSKVVERAKQTLTSLKDVYLQARNN